MKTFDNKIKGGGINLTDCIRFHILDDERYWKLITFSTNKHFLSYDERIYFLGKKLSLYLFASSLTKGLLPYRAPDKKG